jgi:hypothetical protein
MTLSITSNLQFGFQRTTAAGNIHRSHSNCTCSERFWHFIFVARHILPYRHDSLIKWTQLQVLIITESRCEVPRRSYARVYLPCSAPYLHMYLPLWTLRLGTSQRLSISISTCSRVHCNGKLCLYGKIWQATKMKCRKSSEQVDIAVVGVGMVDISRSCGPLEAKLWSRYVWSDA